MLLLANIPNSYSSYYNMDLITEIKPTTFTKPKPVYAKYAAVSFLKSDSSLNFGGGSLDVKSQCGALGYVIPASKCTGFMKTSKLCSDEASMKNVEGANQYTTGCCDSRIYTVTEDQTCPHNSAKLSNDKCFWGGKEMYRCACDRGRYQYSTIKGEQCGSSFSSYNVNLACAAYEPRTQQVEYYFISCCPSDYKRCDATKHQIGRGNECRVVNDKADLITVVENPSLKDELVYSKFEDCPCATHYDTKCSDGQLIDVSNYCTLDNGVTKYTTETNCESNCTKTVETNIDDYLYGRLWHCLYETDGATIKGTEGSLCKRGNLTKYYDACTAQGYTKKVADCYNAEVMLRCPNDTTKVWCLEGKYCTGYDVGTYNGINYCTAGADVDYCPSSDKGTRCQYNNSICHCMWNDGEIDTTLSECRKNLSMSEALDLFSSKTYDGNDLICCKRGYKMYNGICIPNICQPKEGDVYEPAVGNYYEIFAENKGKYPYKQRPGEQMGTEEICYQGDETAQLGYRAYYGYSECNSDPSKGQKWIRKSDDENDEGYRQCICARNSELGEDQTKLPFDVNLFFDTNSDTTDNYAHVGFNQGNYGEQVDCTDAEGSYYGYKSCFIGSTMRLVSGKPTGQCLSAGQNGSYSNTHPYYNTDTQARNLANRILNAAELSSITQATRPVTNKAGDASKVYCINPTQHTGLESSGLYITGCDKGWEQACGPKCYHKVILSGGTLNTQGVKMIVNTHSNGTIQFGFETCPKGFIKSSGSYNTCFKFCSTSNKSACEVSDVLTTYTEAELYNADGTAKFTASSIDKSKIIGVVFARDGRPNISCGTSGKLHVMSLKYITKPLADAQAYPTSDTFKNAVGQSIYDLGTWRLPTATEMGSGCLSQMAMYATEGTTSSLGASVISSSWVANGTYRNCCGTANTSATSNMKARPVVEIAYQSGSVKNCFSSVLRSL